VTVAKLVRLFAAGVTLLLALAAVALLYRLQRERSERDSAVTTNTSAPVTQVQKTDGAEGTDEKMRASGEARPPTPQARNNSDSTQPRVPFGFWAPPGIGVEPYTNTNWAAKIIHNKTGIEMVFIPAGEFMMGSPGGENARPWHHWTEEPAHRVRITRPFYLGKYEVTQGQWKGIMEDKYIQYGKDLAVAEVSWSDCQEFLRNAGDRLRLPTEAEWEYACRAGTRTAYYFGDDASKIDQYGWCQVSKVVEAPPVGMLLPNGWGLYDMYGNAPEWCQDWYEGEYYSRSPVEDPRGPSKGFYRIQRGGSFYSL